VAYEIYFFWSFFTDNEPVRNLFFLNFDIRVVVIK